MKVEKAIKNKILNRLTSIELVVSEKCQNNCSYCYRVKKHNNSTINYLNPKVIPMYLDRFCQFFDVPKDYLKSLTLELFGGDAFLDYEKLYKILEVSMNDYEFSNITIPTNARMVNELHIQDLKKILEVGKRVRLSLSVDGEPSDNQRPLSKYGKMLSYEEKINYTKLIKVAKELKFGFHPMFSFNNCDTWYDTFLFFQEYNIYPYLLEVRHPISKEQSLKCVYQLMKIRKFVDYLKDRNLKQLLNTIYASRIPRGLGCSAHTTFTIMPNGDIPFCHRVVDPPWVSANILTNEWDVSKHITLVSGHHHSNHPICMVCPIKTICSGQCVGASYEYWGDPWIPIESICNYMLLKTYIFSQSFKDWEEITNSINKRVLEEKVFKIFGENKVKELLNDKI